ncbi:DUF6297 family protein [Actinopolymorpha pittospori]
MTAGVDTSQPLVVPSPRALRRELRDRRREHSDRTIWQALDSLYLWLVSFLILGSMSGAIVARAWSQVGQCADATSCVDARDVIPLPLGVAVFALALRMLVALGPVVSSRAGASFMLSAPVDRRGLLLRPAFALLAGGLVLGAAVVTGLVLLTSPHPTAVGAGAVAGAALGVLTVAGAILAQRTSTARKAMGICCDVLIVAALAVVPLFLFGVAVPTTAWAEPLHLLVAAVVVAVGAVAATSTAVAKLGRMPRREVVAGGDLLSGLSGAAASMDTSMVSDMLVARRFRLKGAAHTRRGHGSGLVGVAWREAQRALRSPQRLALAVVLLVVPYAVDRVGVSAAAPLVAAIVGYLAVRPLSGGLHAVSRSAGLRRMFPDDDLPLRTAFSAPLLVGAAVWSLAVVPAIEGTAGLIGPATGVPPFAAWVALAGTIAAGVIRSARRRPVSYEGQLVSTPAGALPAGFVAQIFRGPDFVLVGILPLAFGLPWIVVLLLPVLLFTFALMSRK